MCPQSLLVCISKFQVIRHLQFTSHKHVHATNIHTTSLFCENSPSCKLSRAIHLKGSLTLPPDLFCRKYPELYMFSARPKSATLITPPPSILSTWEMLSKLPTGYFTSYITICERTLQKLTYMQFLAARSRCTKFCDDRYSIPFATCQHKLRSSLCTAPIWGWIQ